MQTRGSQKPVSRKGREGASPSRRTKESEPARALGLAANECAATAVSSEYSALRWSANARGSDSPRGAGDDFGLGSMTCTGVQAGHLEDEPGGRPASSGKRMARETVCGSCPPSSAHGS